MSVPAAFIGVVMIWATTPLAIKWSTEDAGFLFGVASRMVLGVFICLTLVALMSRRMHWHRDALKTYLAAGLGLWAAMSCVYWSAQHIPSGLISVIFGLTPVITGVMAAVWLGESALTRTRILGVVLGVFGLVVIFANGDTLGGSATLGVAGLLFSVSIHSASSVWVKRFGTNLPALETTTGALLIAVPLFVLNWGLFDGTLPRQVGSRSAWSILYLAVFGSVFGFIMYYYLLRQVQASRVALITLITPVLALFIGHYVNAEDIGTRTWIGATMILTGLAFFQWGEQWRWRVSSATE